MEDDWQAKLPPPWPPPPPAGASSTPPPPPLPLPTSGSGSQIPIQSRQRFHSLFAQEATLQGCTMLQEPFGFGPSNLSSCRSGKPDMSNPILALLSGRSLQPPSNFSQLSNSAPAPSDLPSHSSSVTCGVSVTGLATSSRSHGNDTLGNGELSVGTSQSMLVSMGTRNPISWNNVPVVTSPPHSTDVAKLLLHEAVQANGNGMTVLSPRHEWQNSIKLVNGSHLQSPTHLTLPQALEVKSSISGYASALYNGHPRVFCLSTVGELFVSDMGFLGVLCLCHGMRMSVAKFCEHAGAYSVSPGNAARLENGLTIAQWCKLNFGIRVPDDYNGWDWPDSFLPKLCPAGSKANSFPLLLKNHVAPQSEAFSGFRQYGESCGNSVMVNQSSTGTGDQLAFEKSANNDVNSTHQGNNPARSNCYFKGFSDAGQSSVPAVAKSRAVLAAKETPVWINRAAPGLPIYVEELSRGPQSVAGKASSGIREAPPILHASKISSKDFKVGRGNNLSEGYPGDRHAVPSNIELRLGQPSQHKQTCAGLKQTCSGLVPASLCPNQPGVLCNFEKAELLQPLTALCSKEINEFRPIWSTSEILPSNRRLLQDATGKADTPGDSEADPMDNATKNSAISLFLSHLNYTEGNKTSLTTIDAADESEHCMTAVFDSDSLGTRCNLSEYVKNIDDVTEGKSNINGLDPFNHGEKGKAQRVDKDCCCNPLGCISVLDKKLGIDSGAVSELFCHKCSYTCDSRSSLSMLQIAPNMRKSRHSEKVSFKEIKNGHGNHFSHRPQNAAPCATMESSPNLQTAASISATKPLYTLEKSATPAIKQYPNVTQYSSDDCSIHHASRHKAKVSKVELSNGSAEPNNHGRSCCPSALGLQRNDNKEDMVIPEKLRQLSCCSIHQDRFHHFRFFHPCSNGCHGDGFDIITGNDPSLDKCCSCSTLKQRIPLCCKDHHSHFPTSYPCGSDEQALLRYGRTSNSSSAENAKHGICSQKEHRCCLSGQCSCKFPSNCFTGPCFSRDYKFYAPSEPYVCEKAKERTAHGAYDFDRVSECGKRLMENHCECCRKQVFMKNDCQTGFWRDVPDKLIDHTTAIVQEKHAYKFESQELIGRQQTDAMKEIDGPDLETMPMKEQQVSNVCSGYSAPVLTEFSIGINNIDSCATDVCNAKFLDDSVVDEESGIEKCGSSDDPLDNRQIKDFSTKINTFKNPVKSRLRYPPAEDHVSVNSSVLEEVRNENGDLKENVKKLQRPERTDKTRKRKGPIKWRRLNSYLPLSGLSASHSYVPGHVDHLEVQLSSSKENEAPLEPDSDMQKTCILSCRSTIKRKRSTLSSIKSLCWKRSKVDHLNDKPQPCSDGSNPEVSNSSDGTGIKDIQELAEGEEDHLDNETPPRYISLGGMSNSRNPGKISSSEKRKPVVCGNLGIISDGLDGPQKPAKILSLRLIMKNAKKIRPTKREGKVRNLSISHSKKSCQSSSARSSNELLCEKEQLNGNLCRGMKNSMFSRVKREGLEPSGLRSATDKDRSSKNHGCGVELSMVKRETKCGSSRPAMVDTCHQGLNPPQTSMETRKRSLSRLMGGEEHTSSCSPSLGKNECSNLNETGDGQLYKRLGSKKILRGALARKIKWLGNSQDFQEHAVEHYSVSTRRSSKMQTSQPFFPDSDAFCCVCGSSNKDEVNHLLQCSRCFIRVHQACYGVSKVPKGHWYCRPCKSNAKNTVCVLCGYDGGAMTRAVKCRNIVKNLLKVWGVGPEFKSVQTITSIMTSKNKLVEPTSVGEGPSHVESDSGPDTGPASSEATYSVTALDIGLQNQDVATQNIDSPQNNFLVNNTVVAGVIDPSTTQWIHMVCGLWTPGTRCPNVDTMNAFDVSGASPARKNIVCSICNRPGGACIRCRVINCSVHFHPWCAHQKGLLQSEIEGADNEKVGFYGRCSLHATYQSHHIDVSSLEPGVESPRNHEFSCARTQGYRGQKREERFNNFMKPYSDGRVCVVSQEQINAWIHINGQKSLFRSPVKAPSSNVDNDFRKEYIRYKQTKAWKQLVVYKSGIHALGLYTSQFIARGAMVVEYVGEIVGLRVADRREIEYQSGRKLQYKSACYFFRIDKEHIIDATRKGGIARFVNHSCLPNCVAKIISVRNEKKVVFFAERDINPGEEITYDYHFNHEDEGKKIPCFCNSKNCRRYLN